jgi:hypothetical protein
MYISLFVDVEDCSTPLSDDVVKDMADILSSHGLSGNLMVVGDKARALERRGRQDVIATLRRHEIGLHSDRHSRHPTVAEYLENTGWQDGIEEAVQRERPGVEALRRVFGQSPSCWGQPGGSWGPQIHPAVRRLGIPAVVYPETCTPSADIHWYGGALTFGYRHVFGEFDTLYSNDERFQSHFGDLQVKVEAYLDRGLPWMGLFLGHPIYVRAHEFGDVLNLRHGRDTPPEMWRQPPLRTEAEYRTALKNLDALVCYVAAHPRLTATTVGTLCQELDQVVERVGWEDLEDYAVTACSSWDIPTDDSRLSPAQAVDVLARAILACMDGAKPSWLPCRHVDGPAAMPEGIESDIAVSWDALCAGCAQLTSFIDRTGRLPAGVELGDMRAGIGDLYRAFCEAVRVLCLQRLPTKVVVRPAPQTPAIADVIAQRTGRGYRGWVIHKRELDTTRLLELTRLQTWTLKPATFT